MSCVEVSSPIVSDVERIDCPNCHETVLQALTEGGLPVLADVEEIPHDKGQPFACPTCRSERQRDHDIVCWRCGDTGVIGREIVGVLAVGIDEDGVARIFIGGRRAPLYGESLHRVHACDV